MGRFHLPRVRNSAAVRAWHDQRAAQLVEFAVSLPLLVVFVVGIFDFSGAFTIKQKLTNAARDAARVAAADPANDVPPPSAPVPASIADAFQSADNSLIANQLNDCGITQASLSQGGGIGAMTWSASAGGCPPTAGLTSITINRGYFFPQTAAQNPSANCASQLPGGQTAVIGTCVSLQYSYQWRFGRVASLLGATTGLPATITATAVAMNEN
jgi:Flp pilus assembly protein TadG